MMRFAGVLLSALALAACSNSSRVDGIVPEWANTPPHSAKRAVAGSRSEPQTQDAGRSAAVGAE